MDTLKSILYVLPATAVGGAETKFYNIIKHMGGVKSSLLTQHPVAGYFSPLGLRIHLFEDYGCYEPMPVTIEKTIKYSRAIADTVRREAADCIVGIMHTGSFYSSSARDIFRMKVPVIGTIEGIISAFFKKEERTPTVIEKFLLWYLLRRPSLLVVPSKGVKDDLEKNFGISEKRVVVIYNGIDINTVREMAAEQGHMPDGYSGKTIVTACRLNAEKDFITLLRAFREVRQKIESRLVIVGDGELREEIIRQSRHLGIERDVVITGFHRNPFTFIKAADVFVLSSFFEGFGNVIVEAMALQVPVVASDCPSGPGEIIQNGVDGFLAPVKDHHSMAESIMRLLSDEETRRRFVLKGMERAKCFAVEDMTEAFRMLIARLC
jgi:glycosyltransferase involved in cell wall biosynthesis